MPPAEDQDPDTYAPGATLFRKLQMAQETNPNPLHDTKTITWSSLPSLQYTKNYSTRNESTSGFRMTIEQVVDWKNFEADVRENANASLGSQTQIIPTQTEREIVHVGNESGLMGRFGQNIGHVMSEVYQFCNLPINFADYQAGKNNVKHNNIPDWILIDGQHGIRAVGEGKTFWTKKLAETKRLPLAEWLGMFHSDPLSMNRLT
jgi:hypothetical protein